MKAFLHFGTGSEPRQTVEVEVKLAEMRHHKLGLTWTASGYGPRIPSSYMVRWAGRWRRVYVAQYGNAGSAYIGPARAWLATVDIEG